MCKELKYPTTRPPFSNRAAPRVPAILPGSGCSTQHAGVAGLPPPTVTNSLLLCSSSLVYHTRQPAAGRPGSRDRLAPGRVRPRHGADRLTGARRRRVGDLLPWDASAVTKASGCHYQQ